MKRESSIAAASSGRESADSGHCPPFCGLGAAKAVAKRLAPGGMVLREQRVEARPAAAQALSKS